MTIFNLPDLGEGLPDAEIHQWYVAEGDEVKLDQPLVAMETAKAVVDVPSPVAGRVAKLHGKPGDIILTGAPLIEFASNNAAVSSNSVETTSHANDTLVTTVAASSNRTPTQIKAAPAVRMLANKLGIDLNAITGSGPDGAITSDDVNRASASTTGNKATASIGEALHGARRTMAQQMAKSHAEVVPVTLTEYADIHRWREKTDVTLRLIQAVAAACQAEPALNAHFYGANTSRKLWSEINLGIAVDTPAGLYVPVIKNVAEQSPEVLRATLNTFKEKAKAQTFTPADLQDATITLSNFGTIAGLHASPIIVPPTVAIIGIGKSRDMVVADNGQPAVHKVMPISLTFDHRAATGGEAARFLGALVASLEHA